MRIWVDADACPGVIKEILFRAAERTKVTVTLIANQPLRVPPSKYIKTLQVRAAEQKVTLLHPRDYNYYELLRSKLNWGRANRTGK